MSYFFKTSVLTFFLLINILMSVSSDAGLGEIQYNSQYSRSRLNYSTHNFNEFSSPNYIRDESGCANKTLVEKGWEVEAITDLEEVLERIIREIDEHSVDYLLQGEYRFYSSSAKTWSKLKVIDYLLTPQDEMFGDIVIISDLFTFKVREVRYYLNDAVSVYYDMSQQKCVTNLVPFVDNSLY